jgi:cell division transport system permease protein
MKNWLRQHARSLTATLKRLVRSPLSSALNIGVMGTALALPLAFYVILANLQSLAQDRAPTPQISIFLALDAQPTDAHEIDNRLKKQASVAKFRFVPRDQALAELKAKSGLADVIASLGRNPLPDGFVIDARDSDPAALERLRDEFKSWPKVEHVQLDSAWARRLDATLRLGRLVVLVFGTLLAFTLVAVTFNTIRLQILTQRAEIEVAKLIGATNPFIRRPFLYYGAALGLAGALTAWLIVWAGLWLLNDRLGSLTQLYGASLALRHLSLPDAASLCVFSAALGWLGAWLSASRNLAEFDPQ